MPKTNCETHTQRETFHASSVASFFHEAAAADIDSAWADEAQRRLRAYECGLTQGVLAEEVLGPF